MRAKKPLVAIVTPVFKELDSVKSFVASVKKQSYKNYVCIIVDAGSSDGTAEYVRSAGEKFILVSGTPDWWWSHSTNQGVKKALALKAEFVLTVNTDVILHKNYLNNIVEAALSEGKRALVGSLVTYQEKPEEAWYAGGYFDQETGSTAHITGITKQFSKRTTTEWLTGMGALIPTSAYREVGMYDQDNFPQYFGDADFALRAAHQGYSLVVDPGSIISCDVSSNWVTRQFDKPRIRFFYDLFFSIRSPYQVKTRRLFYKKYWPGDWRGALRKYYTEAFTGLVYNFLKRYISYNILRRKRGKI